MTEENANNTIKDLPIGAKLQIVKTNGDIVDVVLASHETAGTEKKKYDSLEVPAQPAAISVHGGRWGVYRIPLEEIVTIAHINKD